MLIRACKATLVGIVALLMTLIALGNVLNYDANWAFVKHVLAMDTIFSNSQLKWRAITNSSVQAAAYLGIIAWEALCAMVCGVPALVLLISARNENSFERTVPAAVLGVTMVLVLFGAGFLAIGGEWFLMWQSTTWNGTDSAIRYFTVAGLTLITLLVRNAPKIRRSD